MKKTLLLLGILCSMVQCKKDKTSEDTNNSGSTNTSTDTSADIVPFTVSVTIDGVTTNFQYGNGDLDLLYSSSLFLTSSARITPAASLSDIPNSGSSNPGYIYIQLPARYAAKSLWEDDPAQFFINYFNETYNLSADAEARFDVLFPNGDSWYLHLQPNAGSWINSYEVIKETSLALVRIHSNLNLTLKNSLTNEIKTANVQLSFQFQQPG